MTISIYTLQLNQEKLFDLKCQRKYDGNYNRTNYQYKWFKKLRELREKKYIWIVDEWILNSPALPTGRRMTIKEFREMIKEAETEIEEGNTTSLKELKALSAKCRKKSRKMAEDIRVDVMKSFTKNEFKCIIEDSEDSGTISFKEAQRLW